MSYGKITLKSSLHSAQITARLFIPPDNLSENTGSSFLPQISLEGNNVYVVWQDDTLGSFNIFFAFSTDNGQTFSTPEHLTEENTGGSSFGSFGPKISSEGNNVYVIWEKNISPRNFDIFFAFSTDNGQTFCTPDNLSENTGISEDPQISSEGNKVYVVWAERGLPGNNDIFYTTNNQDFGLFGTALNLSNNPDSNNLNPHFQLLHKSVVLPRLD